MADLENGRRDAPAARELLYADRDPEKLDAEGGYYLRHILAMTSENLYSKASIAAELAHRDMLIDQMTFALDDISLCANSGCSLDDLRTKIALYKVACEEKAE